MDLIAYHSDMSDIDNGLFHGINRILFKLSGVRLTRSTPLDLVAQSNDASAAATMQFVRQRTMTDQNRLHNLIIAIRHVVNKPINGAIIECGVWRGGSMMAAALTLLELGDESRDLYLFDTYSGMTNPIEKDKDYSGRSAESQMLSSKKVSGEYTSDVKAKASLPDVIEGMESTGYPKSKIKYVSGDVCQTLFATELPTQIALLRLDTDWYESTKVELEVLWNRVTTGGIVILDDYDHWEGAKIAVDEFFADRSDRPILIKMLTGRIIVKTS
jgi:O-methyltransferase